MEIDGLVQISPLTVELPVSRWSGEINTTGTSWLFMVNAMKIDESVQTDILQQASDEVDIQKLVHGAIAYLQRSAGGVRPGPRDLGTAIQVAQQWIRAAGLHTDRQSVSEIVKAELSK